MKNKDGSVKPGYKMTPLGEIPEDWEVKRLGDIAVITMGQSPEGITYNNLGIGLPLLNGPTEFGAVHPVAVQWTSWPTKLSTVGDLLLCVRGSSVGRVNISDTQYCIGRGVAAIKARETSDQNFLRLLISNVITKILILTSGSTFPNIDGRSLKSFEVSLPPVYEQKAIAKVLSTWDKAIEITRQLIEKKELRKKTLMQQLLTGKKRLKGFSGEWKEVRLGEVFSERNEAYTKGLPLLTIGIDGIYLQSESSKRDISNDDKSKYKRICPGDIGYNTMRMWQGRCVLSHLEGIVSPAYTVVTALEGQSSEFYALLFTLPETVYKFYRHSQGLVKDTLNCKFPDFAQIKVHSPGVEEQIAIANLLGITDADLKIEKERLEKLKLQKKALMQVLLTGKKRIGTKPNE